MAGRGIPSKTKRTGSPLEALRGLMDIPASALRGMASATLGFPGDVAEFGAEASPLSFGPTPSALALSAMTKPMMSAAHRFLPTTREVSALLPAGPHLPSGEKLPYEYMGELAPVTPGGLSKLVSPLGRLAGEAMNRAMLEGSGPLAKVLGAARPMNVVKPRGGQWLTGEVEKELDPLLLPTAQDVQDLQPFVGRLTEGQRADLRTPLSNEALNAWVQGPLTKYIKRDLATPEDPIRALAERGILHYDPEAYRTRDMGTIAKNRRLQFGFPLEGEARAPLARNWEDISDYLVGRIPAGELEGYPPTIQANPWLTRASDDELVSLFNARPNNVLGFSHLVDELKGALNPESGLPANLLLRPESLSRLSVPQAVQRVHDINKWRRAQIDKALIADMAGIPIVKEYPGGYKWVELKPPKGASPDVRIPSSADELGFEEYQRMGADPDILEAASLRYMDEGETQPLSHYLMEEDPEWMTQIFKLESPETKATMKLKKWLKDEGDAMGHCVGGYCDDVLSGKSRIFSLRDAKGQPHVTIETNPDPDPYFMDLLEEGRIPKELEDQLIATRDQGHPGWTKAVRNDPRYKEFLAGLPKSYRIAQIKGKANLAPKDEYLPFVQDFVKSQGPWSEVGDLQNTGLIDTRQLAKGYSFGIPQEDYQRLVDAGLKEKTNAFENMDYATIDEIIQHLTGGAGFAEGGAVDAKSIIEKAGGRMIDPEVMKIIRTYGGTYA